VYRYPSGAFAWAIERRRISIKHAVVFPDPTGPAATRPNADDFMKVASVGGAV
jgi:hypothetical protein